MNNLLAMMKPQPGETQEQFAQRMWDQMREKVEDNEQGEGISKKEQ